MISRPPSVNAPPMTMRRVPAAAARSATAGSRLQRWRVTPNPTPATAADPANSRAATVQAVLKSFPLWWPSQAIVTHTNRLTAATNAATTATAISGDT